MFSAVFYVLKTTRLYIYKKNPEVKLRDVGNITGDSKTVLSWQKMMGTTGPIKDSFAFGYL